jgi:ABC-type bacteriocin/lantibiotic exporter with double-glycine peptidase domain
MALIISLSTAIILWFGGQRVIGGQMTLGQLVAFNS